MSLMYDVSTYTYLILPLPSSSTAGDAEEPPPRFIIQSLAGPGSQSMSLFSFLSTVPSIGIACRDTVPTYHCSRAILHFTFYSVAFD